MPAVAKDGGAGSPTSQLCGLRLGSSELQRPPLSHQTLCPASRREDMLVC